MTDKSPEPTTNSRIPGVANVHTDPEGEVQHGNHALTIGIALLILGILWFPFATIPGPGFGAPWITSEWWLLWPAVCLAVAVRTIFTLRRTSRFMRHRCLNLAIALHLLILGGGAYAVHSQRLFEEMMVKGHCASQLERLGAVMRIYASSNENIYPVPEKWCDALVVLSKRPNIEFWCGGSDVQLNYIWVEPNGEPYYEEEMILSWQQENGYRQYVSKICTYAINPNCEPNSPNDIVLLFETKGGWNQQGGPELLTFDNHKGKGANVLFNDGHVEFVKPDEVGKLRWK